jgi:hypothetical protein
MRARDIIPAVSLLLLHKEMKSGLFVVFVLLAVRIVVKTIHTGPRPVRPFLTTNNPQYNCYNMMMIQYLLKILARMIYVVIQEIK